MRKIISIVLLGIFSLGIFTGCGIFHKKDREDAEDEVSPVSSIVLNDEEAEVLAEKVPLYLYFSNPDSNKLKLEVRYIPKEEANKSTEELAGIIVNELIKGPSSKEGFEATIPSGSQLKAAITVKDGIATVNLSKEFIDNHPGGKDAEKKTIYSIVNSLTELKDIEKVKFLIEGEERAEFKGNFKFDAPFPRDTRLIGKDAAKPGSTSMAAPERDDSDDEDKSEDENSENNRDEEEKDSASGPNEGDTVDVSGDDYLDPLE
jgi:germination protein M